MQKAFFLCLVAVCVTGGARVCAQNVGIGTINPKQKLHVAGGLRVDTLSNGKDSGLLRHTADGTVFSLAFSGDSTQVLRGNGTFGVAVATPVAGLTPFAPVTNPWLLGGNAGVTPATNFLGTTDNAALRLRINNQWAGMLDSVSQSTFFGYGAGKNDTTVLGNTAMGYQALNAVSTGVLNTAMGVRALPVNTSGSQNTAIGVQALQNNTTGGNNVAVGLNCMNVNSTGTDNTAVGVQALNFNTSGGFNVAVGRSALFANSVGSENVAVGHKALAGNSTGFSNVIAGTRALANCVDCYNTVAIGDSALLIQSTTVAGNSVLAIDNTAVGSKVLMNNTAGFNNTAMGFHSMQGNSTGQNNTAMGWFSMLGNSSGNANVAIGSGALALNVSGSDNVAIGNNALGTTNFTGSDNTAVGNFARTSVDGLSNATAIGSQAVVTASNTVQLGNSATVTVSSTGNFVTVSDGRFKFNIREDVKGLDFILRLRPVSYQFDVRRFDGPRGAGYAQYAAYDEAMALRRTGFIAQEVETAAKEAGYDFTGVERPRNEGGHYSLSYPAFIMPMVKAIQEQQREIDDLRKIVAEQRKMIDQLLHH